MGGSRLGIVFFMRLLFSIPGTKLLGALSKKYNQVISLKSFDACLASITILCGLILDRYVKGRTLPMDQDLTVNSLN